MASRGSSLKATIIGDFDLKKKAIRCVRLSKLWKYEGRPAHLQARDPPLIVLTMTDPRHNTVDFIVGTFNSTEKVNPANFPGLAEKIPKRVDGKPWYTYLMGLTTFAAVHMVPVAAAMSIPITAAIPLLTQKIHVYGARDAFPDENGIAKWIRKKTGHSYLGHRDPPYNPCPKCGRVHLPDKKA